MKLKDTLENYYYHSGKTSEIVRQLGFAGIAIVWVFKTEVAGNPTIAPELIPAALLVVVGLTLDLLHYVAGSLIWGIYHRIKEDAVTGDTEFLAPRQINWPVLFFFWSKILAMVAAYGFILRFLYHLLA